MVRKNSILWFLTKCHIVYIASVSCGIMGEMTIRQRQALAPSLRAKTLHILQSLQRKLIRFLLLTVGFLLWAF